LGYDFNVEYKKGVDNKVADALSRREDNDVSDVKVSLLLLSIPRAVWVEELKAEYDSDQELQTLLSQWQNHKLDTAKYSCRDGLLLYKNRIVLGQSPQLKNKVLSFVHSDPTSGHSRYDKTLQRAKKDFFWKGMRKDLKSFIRGCDICQRSKHENSLPAGLLQPLPIPSRVWSHITMDFIEGLPFSQGQSVIMVVVDRLSKYAHFLTLSHPYTAVTVAKLFVSQVFKLHGMPLSIVSDRDPVFTSAFWREFFKLQGTSLDMSSSYHPQTDGQSEIVNKCLENYLRCFAQDNPKQWVSWLPWAEYWYNTSWHTSIRMTPYEAVYGVPPPRLLAYVPGTTRVETVDEVLKSRQQILALLQHNLQQAQQRMKRYADLKRSERSFEIGQLVYLRLQPYRQSTIAVRRSLKLSPRFYGPFPILRKVGQVAYELELPPEARIHPVFHVSQLKLKVGSSTEVVPKLPPVNSKGILQPEPVEVLSRRLRPKNHRAYVELLIRWEGQHADDATWEDFHVLKEAYPHLVGKVF